MHRTRDVVNEIFGGQRTNVFQQNFVLLENFQSEGTCWVSLSSRLLLQATMSYYLIHKLIKFHLKNQIGQFASLFLLEDCPRISLFSQTPDFQPNYKPSLNPFVVVSVLSLSLNVAFPSRVFNPWYHYTV